MLDLAEHFPRTTLGDDELVAWCEIVSGYRIANATPTPIPFDVWREQWRNAIRLSHAEREF